MNLSRIIIRTVHTIKIKELIKVKYVGLILLTRRQQLIAFYTHYSRHHRGPIIDIRLIVMALLIPV